MIKQMYMIGIAKDSNRSLAYNPKKSPISPVQTSASYKNFKPDPLELYLSFQNYTTLMKAINSSSACVPSARSLTTVLEPDCYKELVQLCCNENFLYINSTNSTEEELKKLACVRALQAEAILDCKKPQGIFHLI
jgi:hypothetical protein